MWKWFYYFVLVLVINGECIRFFNLFYLKNDEDFNGLFGFLGR